MLGMLESFHRAMNETRCLVYWQKCARKRGIYRNLLQDDRTYWKENWFVGYNTRWLVFATSESSETVKVIIWKCICVASYMDPENGRTVFWLWSGSFRPDICRLAGALGWRWQRKSGVRSPWYVHHEILFQSALQNQTLFLVRLLHLVVHLYDN